jgi:hypothetical protein
MYGQQPMGVSPAPKQKNTAVIVLVIVIAAVLLCGCLSMITLFLIALS